MARKCTGLVLAVMGASLAAGCVEYKWEESFERAEQRSKAEKKYLFVYYWKCFDNDSNRMSEVINKPDVAKLFQNTVNCQISYEFPPNRQYVAKHGIDRWPAFMIKSPDGSYQKRAGFVSQEGFMQWARSALTSSQTDRLKPPPPAPTAAPPTVP
jgi:hypothetical protein